MGIAWGTSVLAAILGILGFGLIICALFGNRSRKRRRCPKCWYDLSHSPGMTCGECGYRASQERDWRKTRRHWRWAVVGILIAVLGYVAGVIPRVSRSWDHWPGLVPTSVLIGLEPWLGEVDTALRYELGLRAITQPMWSWQEAWLTKRCESVVAGDSAVPMRVWAVGALCHLGERNTAPVLTLALEDDDPNVLAAAVGALGATRGLSVASLIDLLNNPNSQVREQAAWALWQLGCDGEAAMPALRERMNNDPIPLVRVRSALAMSRMHPQ